MEEIKTLTLHNIPDCMHTGDHELVAIWTEGGPMSADVVRWCVNCGAIVVDTDYDGRTNPGYTMKMRYPEITKWAK